MSNRKRMNMQPSKTQLPPIINEDDGELPFFKQDFFSDVALIIQGRKLYTARCLLAYHSPVFDKSLGNAKKHEMELPNKTLDDMVELLCYIDPRVQYTITAQTAKQLLPLAEEYEMFKLRRLCEGALYSAYEHLRKEYRLGQIPPEINEEYLIMSDRYKFDTLLLMCVDEHVHCPSQDMTKSLVSADAVSEEVKLMILERKLERLNHALGRERRYKFEAEHKLDGMAPKRKWTNKFALY